MGAMGTGTGAVTGPAAAASIQVGTADDMRALGQRLAGLLRPGDLVVLSGPLGAGKTTLVQGIGQGLNVRGPVTSPTFVIARVHPPLGGGPALVHADAYRLANPAEVDDLDLDADVSSSVTVVEWGEGLVEGLAADRLEVTIAISRDGATGSLEGPAGSPRDGAAGSLEGPAGSPRDGAAGSLDGPAGSLDGAAGSQDGLDGGSRTVRVSGVGERWMAAAVESVRCALPGTSEAL
jgi:tRNA threonylcarbamoyladenosine biosynthesis protein TsaE